MTNGPIGKSLLRLEDQRFLTGRGVFIDDVNLPGQAWAQVVRSPHAHARLVSIDTSEARRRPGVLGVFTSADIAELGCLPCATTVATVRPMIVPPRPALAVDRVRHVGDPVAFVVAETREQALDSADLVTVNYDPLPAVVDAQAATLSGSVLLWDEARQNVAYEFEKGDSSAVIAALSSARHVVELNLVNNRIIVAAIETRGAIADVQQGTLHLMVSAAGVHAIRDQLATSVFGCPRDRIRVSAPDVGGGFGVKNALYPEWVLLLWAARRLGRPIKLVQSREEDFVSTAQGRDNITHAQLALDEQGDFLALNVRTFANLGAYMSGGGPGSSTNAPAAAMGGGYVIPAIAMHVQGVFTNTVPVDAYRGAGKPEANYLLERLIDEAARKFGFDPVELRKRNSVREFPYRKALGTTIDCGSFSSNIDTAVSASNYAMVEERKGKAAPNGKLRGIGVACFLETARGAPNEGAELRFTAEGTVELLIGTQSNGQGHETSYPQIASELLGVPLASFRYIQGDTGQILDGNGHGGARSMHMGGTALVRAAEKVIEKGMIVAAQLLQARSADLEFVRGHYSLRADPTTRIDLLSVAKAARDLHRSIEGLDAGLDTYVWNLLDVITFPNGCHVAEVEVDPETGIVELLRYLAVDDFGSVINPMITIGQVQGGVAQGIGQALLERTIYDEENGQLLTGSFLDYAIPRASDLPDLEIVLSGVPTAANPLGVKGAGQAGAIAAPQTIMSAILDALAPLGVEHVDMPATPERVWRAIQSARH